MFGSIVWFGSSVFVVESSGLLGAEGDGLEVGCMVGVGVFESGIAWVFC